MKKTDKKIENALIKALTKACTHATESCPGFQWLTHTVNFQRFPKSLTVVCVFESQQQATNANILQLEQLIKEQLAAIGINTKHIKKLLLIDSEENGADINNPLWFERLTVH